MNSMMFKLDASDFAKGFIMAALAAIVTALAQAMSLPGFDYSTFNWNQLLTIGVSAGLTYLLKNYLSDQSGAFLGRIG